MRNILTSIFVVLLLCIAGCTNPDAAKKAKDDANAELVKIQNDDQMVVSDWYRSGYYLGDNGVNIFNHILLKALGLHVLLWLGVSLLAGFHDGDNYDSMGIACAFFIFGNLVIFALWVVFWLLGGIIASVFSPNYYVPFGFVGFVLLLATYAAVGSLIIGFAFARLAPKHKESNQSFSAIAREAVASRRARVMRAMAKALFVAIASAIGSKLGGLVGGIIVFVISAGISTFFEIPSGNSNDQ